MRSNGAMRVSRLALLVLGLASSTTLAVVPRHGMLADTLTALPNASVTKPLRTHQTLVIGQPTAAWKHFAALAGGTWEANWDQATGVPSRIWGSGIAAPGAIASAAIAERIARAVLADHIALLAPGAQPSDFELVSNSFDGNIRSVGFLQHAGGLRVVGGQVSFRFKRDRLFVIGSEALPNVTVPRVVFAATIPTAQVRTALALASAVITAGDPVIVPFVGDTAVLGYRVARPLTVDGGKDGHYLAYADATGAVLAVRRLDHSATGSLVFNGVDRYPEKGRVDRPAPRDFITLDGTAVTTDPTGAVTWAGTNTQTLVPSIRGDLVGVVNQSTGGMPTTTLSLDPGGSARWDASAVVEDDAQLNVFVDINIAKEFVRANIDPSMPTLDNQLIANANLDQDCNSFYDPGQPSVNFFHASPMCQNTGLVQDVQFHEFGHHVHYSEVIPGVGAVDGAMSEGVADTLAVNITGDSGMGRGFFYNDEPIRELNPPNKEYRYPQDLGEIHQTGMIYGGTFWDLRTAFIALLGQDAGVAKTLQLYVATLRRAVNIETTLVEALAADDDDGDLSNGTPNECLILEAFGAHGLRVLGGSTESPATYPQPTLGASVAVQVTGLSTRCDSDTVRHTTFRYQPGVNGLPVAGDSLAVALTPTIFSAQIPLAANDSTLYKAIIQFDDGGTFTLADNLADPFYQLYTGATVPLYCTTFDTDPFMEGWTTDTSGQWSWGVPTGGGTDPPSAFTGTNILAQVLNGDYPASKSTVVYSPPIDVGQYTDVRLQYRRWLAIDDAQFDQAHITANRNVAWQNATANIGGSSFLQHIDKEWRFHDVPLTTFFSGHQVTVGFDLKSDGAFELGGWAIDDLCVVANPLSICGDGVVSQTEQCDDGSANADVPDACRTYCKKPACGDNIVDMGEECDDGSGGSVECTAKCTLNPVTPGGCCSAGGGAGSLALGVIVLGLVRRRRRA